MEAAVQLLKKGKSAEADHIPEVVQAGGEAVITVLTTTCNKIWQTGEWPTPWIQSLVIALPKKGNLQQCQNYRTISHQDKVMPRTILSKLTLQRRKEHHRTDLQPKNPLSQTSPPQAKPLPYFHKIHEAFDRVRQTALLVAIKKYNTSDNLIRVIRVITHLSDKTTSAVLFNGSIG